MKKSPVNLNYNHKDRLRKSQMITIKEVWVKVGNKAYYMFQPKQIAKLELISKTRLDEIEYIFEGLSAEIFADVTLPDYNFTFWVYQETRNQKLLPQQLWIKMYSLLKWIKLLFLPYVLFAKNC